MNDAIQKTYRVAIITASDKGAQGLREDLSGAAIKQICQKKHFTIVSQIILPDEQKQLSQEMTKIADQGLADLILTTGGTGLSPRDCTPEATLAIADRNVPGIAEAMRANSLTLTKMGMLSRGIAVIRKQTLIINLPGSVKAVEENLMYLIDVLPHAIGTLLKWDTECGRTD